MSEEEELELARRENIPVYTEEGRVKSKGKITRFGEREEEGPQMQRFRKKREVAMVLRARRGWKAKWTCMKTCTGVLCMGRR